MNDILETLKTTDPDRLAFVSYTRQGTYEGVKRAQEKFKLKAVDVPFFKTIHALCFKELGMRKYDMFQKKHYKILSEKLGINFTGYYTQDYTSPNDAYLHAINMERHNPELALQMSRDMNESKYEYIKINYTAIKKQLGIKDFDDLLEEYLEYCKPFDIDVAYIDEGQDLTPLQWKVVNKMFSKAKIVTVAGDDDQAVYQWAGADVKQFLGFSTESVVLHKSYRLPEKARRLALNITRDIALRKNKEFTSKGEEGVVETVHKLSNVKFEGGEMILARTNYKLRQLAEELEERGIYYVRKGFASISPNTLKAITTYKAFYKGEEEESALKKFGKLFSTIDRNIPWQDALDESYERKAYYDKVMQSDWLDKDPVTLETFHSCKGSERDHVIISPDLSLRVNKELGSQRDAELRCLYVAFTRTKNKMTLLTPEWKNYYPTHYFNT